jgi:hypothetical protein
MLSVKHTTIADPGFGMPYAIEYSNLHNDGDRDTFDCLDDALSLLIERNNVMHCVITYTLNPNYRGATYDRVTYAITE